MERAEVILDASVAVKWFSREEEESDPALKLRDEHLAGRMTLIFPDLLIYEVSNALRHNPGFDAGDVKGAVKDL